MPFSFCSMTWVTVSCTVWAEAPGYTALMVICGGAIGRILGDRQGLDRQQTGQHDHEWRSPRQRSGG
jgi:hypothetical protein